jgi:hypothetical protein
MFLHKDAAYFIYLVWCLLLASALSDNAINDNFAFVTSFVDLLGRFMHEKWHKKNTPTLALEAKLALFWSL